MMNMRTAGLLAAATLTGWALQAAPTDEEPQQMSDVVVSAATLQETSVEKLGQSVTLITREELEASKLTYVKDYLRRVPGLNLRSNGTNGNTSVSVRGLQPYHTKLMIDGVAYHDALGTQSFPVLNTLQVEDVERIEVVRGASSTVNGSSAIGGVINIVTRSGKDTGEAVTGSVGAEYGSHGRQAYTGNVRGATGPVDYSLTANWMGERGISAMTNSAALDDNDPYRNASFSGRVGLDLTEQLRLEVFGRYSDADVEFDGATPDTNDIHQQDWLVGGRLAAEGLLDGVLDSSLTLSYSDLRRCYRNDALFDWNVGDSFRSMTVEAEWLNTVHVAEGYDFTFGVNSTSVEGESTDGGAPAIEERHRTMACFGELQAEPIENLFLTAGARYNEHSLFGHETTWSASARYFFEDTGTTLKAAAGKAYRAPSLYELYMPYSYFPPFGSWAGYISQGNPELEPETSQNWEVGFEQSLAEGKVTFGATYYESRVDNYIGWVDIAYNAGTNVYTSSYLNISGIKVHGVESFIRYQPVDCLSLQVTHTYQHTNSMDDSGFNQELSPIAYRPSHMASFDAVYTGCNDRLTVDLNANFVGSRRTANGTGGTKLDSYCLMALAVSYDLTENLEIYGRIENLLNDGYETNLNYGTYGRCYYAGLKYSF